MAEDGEKQFNGWDKLDVDILVKIFRNYFSLQELTSGLAHVCRGWRVACCDPILWNTLDLSHMKPGYIEIQTPDKCMLLCSDEELTRILKLTMSLSKGNIRTLIFPFNLFLIKYMVTYTAERCPNLRCLVLPDWNSIKNRDLSNAIKFCKNLESLTIPSIPFLPGPNPNGVGQRQKLDQHYFPRLVFESIAMNCKNFRELKVMGPIELNFAQALVSLLPNLKVLSLRCCAINRDALITILDKLKSLEVLNITHSYLTFLEQKKLIIVRELDETIKNKASKLKQFFTCVEYKTCEMCHLTEEYQRNTKWYKYEEGLWKADEISSLHLKNCFLSPF